MSPGETRNLKAVLATGGPLEPARAVNLVRQIAGAINDAHSNQAIHREITPANILVSGSDYAYLADIGSALAHTDLTPLTYRAPELVTNTEVTYRADIYALAAVLYECLTGVPPYRPVTADAPALIAAQLNGAIPRPSQQQPGVPSEFDDVIARGMAKNPADRYSSTDELAAAAQQVVTSAAQREVPSRRLTTPDPDAAPDAGESRTVVLKLPPAQQHPLAAGQPDTDPSHGAGPTVTYPNPQPLPPGVVAPSRGRRRRALLIAAAAAIVAVVIAVAAIAIPRFTRHGTHDANAASTPTTHTYSAQPTALPFPSLEAPKNVAVDKAGNVYVLSGVSGEPSTTEFGGAPKQVLKFAPGATSPAKVEIPGVDLNSAKAMTVDAAGNIYIANDKNVWELAPGAASAIRLPFRGFVTLYSIAVDRAGNVYAAGGLNGDGKPYGVMKLIPGDARPADLPFDNLYLPYSIAVDNADNVYVGTNTKNGPGRVLKLAAGAKTPTEVPIPGLKEATGLAVDAAGSLFVADNFAMAVWTVPAGATAPAKLPLKAKAAAVAVDAAGDVYVAVWATRDKEDKLIKPGQLLKLTPDH